MRLPIPRPRPPQYRPQSLAKEGVVAAFRTVGRASLPAATVPPWRQACLGASAGSACLAANSLPQPRQRGAEPHRVRLSSSQHHTHPSPISPPPQPRPTPTQRRPPRLQARAAPLSGADIAKPRRRASRCNAPRPSSSSRRRTRSILRHHPRETTRLPPPPANIFDRSPPPPFRRGKRSIRPSRLLPTGTSSPTRSLLRLLLGPSLGRQECPLRHLLPSTSTAPLPSRLHPFSSPSANASIRATGTQPTPPPHKLFTSSLQRDYLPQWDSDAAAAAAAAAS